MGCGRLPEEERLSILADAGETRQPILEIDCPRCGGYDDDCDLCLGSGVVPRFSCAGHEARGLETFMRCYGNLVTHGVWPMPGGLCAQTAAFVTAVGIADGERAKIERETIERGRAKDQQPPPTVLGADGMPARTEARRMAQRVPATSGKPGVIRGAPPRRAR